VSTISVPSIDFYTARDCTKEMANVIELMSQESREELVGLHGGCTCSATNDALALRGKFVNVTLMSRDRNPTKRGRQRATAGEPARVRSNAVRVDAVRVAQ
jgi:hypothetical protein